MENQNRTLSAEMEASAGAESAAGADEACFEEEELDFGATGTEPETAGADPGEEDAPSGFLLIQEADADSLEHILREGGTAIPADDLIPADAAGQDHPMGSAAASLEQADGSAADHTMEAEVFVALGRAAGSARSIDAGQLEAAFAGEIDTVIAQMLQQSRDNYAQIEGLALECSAALTSAEAKSSGLSEQGIFKRLWNSLTGKNERLRSSIEKDRAAAQYAMQQAINSVLRECTQNRLLALAVKSKLEGAWSRPENPDRGA